MSVPNLDAVCIKQLPGVILGLRPPFLACGSPPPHPPKKQSRKNQCTHCTHNKRQWSFHLFYLDYPNLTYPNPQLSELSELPNINYIHSICGVHQLELTSPPIENILLHLSKII